MGKKTKQKTRARKIIECQEKNIPPVSKYAAKQRAKHKSVTSPVENRHNNQKTA